MSTSQRAMMPCGWGVTAWFVTGWQVKLCYHRPYLSVSSNGLPHNRALYKCPITRLLYWFRWNKVQYLRRYCIHPVFRVIPAVTVTFDLFTTKSIQHIYESKYMCDQNWAKFPSLVFEIWCSQSFWDAQTHSRTVTPKYRVPRCHFSTVPGA